MRQVRCIETGQVFNSITDAARRLGVTPAAISHVLKGRQATAAGHTWEYAQGVPVPQKRYTGLYRDRNGGVYTSLRAFAQRHGYTIRQVQAATVTDNPSPRLIDLPTRVPSVRKIRIQYINDQYLIDGLPATTFPTHPLLASALAQARLSGKVVELIPMPDYEEPET